MGGETLVGFIQSAFQGTPLNTCLPVVGTGSACQYAEGRGNFVTFSRAANGDFSVSGMDRGSRTDNFLQTDISVRHEFPVKGHEGMRVAVEGNITNLFNQRAGVSYVEGPVGSTGQLINPVRASRFSGDPQVDFGKVMNGYSYLDALNSAGAFAGAFTNTPGGLTLASRYGLPQVFQGARNMRLAVRFTF
jgi:hypothetical protein